MQPLVCLAGPSGSGKTSLILAVLKAVTREIGVVRSCTTRPPRKDDLSDLLFYRFVTHGDLVEQLASGNQVSLMTFDGNGYAWDKRDLDEVLATKIGIVAMITERAFSLLRNAGYTLVIVRVDPSGADFKPRSSARQKEEKTHVYTSMLDLVLNNRFEPGGFDKAVEQLAAFINQL